MVVYGIGGSYFKDDFFRIVVIDSLCINGDIFFLIWFFVFWFNFFVIGRNYRGKNFLWELKVIEEIV